MPSSLTSPPVSPPATPSSLQAARTATATIFFINGALFATWVSRIPAVQSKLGLDHAELGTTLLCVALGALIAMPVSGWWAAKVGSRKVTSITAIIFCMTVPGLALVSNGWELGIALFVFGSFNGALDVAMNAQAVAIEEAYRRPIMSSFHALWSAGGLVGAALGGWAAAAGIAPLTHFAVGSLIIGGAATALALPWLLAASDASPSSESGLPTLVWPPKSLVILGAVAFCIMMGEGAMADWSAIYLRRNTGSSEGLAAAGYAAFSIAMAGGRFFGDGLAARFGPACLVRLGTALAATGLGAALLLGDTISALIGFTCVGAGFATIVPQVFSAAGRTPGMASGPALATASILGYSGFLLGPPIIGIVAQHAGLRPALGIVALMSALAFVLGNSVRPASLDK